MMMMMSFNCSCRNKNSVCVCVCVYTHMWAGGGRDKDREERQRERNRERLRGERARATARESAREREGGRERARARARGRARTFVPIFPCNFPLFTSESLEQLGSIIVFNSIYHYHYHFVILERNTLACRCPRGCVFANTRARWRGRPPGPHSAGPRPSAGRPGRSDSRGGGVDRLPWIAWIASLEALGSTLLKRVDRLPWSALIASLGARGSPPSERVDVPCVALMGSLEHRPAARRCGCTRLREHASQTSTKRAATARRRNAHCAACPDYFLDQVLFSQKKLVLIRTRILID